MMANQENLNTGAGVHLLLQQMQDLKFWTLAGSNLAETLKNSSDLSSQRQSEPTQQTFTADY